MKKLIFALGFICVIIGILNVVKKPQSFTSYTKASNQTPTSLIIEHSSHLYDPEFFRQADHRGERYKKAAPSNTLGGIIPHHLLAAPLIAAFSKA